MAIINDVRAKVKNRLTHNYPGNPNDANGSNDSHWINKKQDYEVSYAIAYCLIQCNAVLYASIDTMVQRLEKVIQNMDHDSLGRCVRNQAYIELENVINYLKSIK